MADRTGQQLGNYRVIRPIGRGGFAEVYLGEHIYLKTQVAIKLLQTKVTNPEDLDGFLKEAQTIARLVHPNIIRVTDFGVDAETPFLVMDYAPNGTLRQRHPKGTALPLITIVPYVKQIAAALQHAHEEKLIHRDIKPENMLIGRKNDILLSDFGIALIAQSSRYQSTQEVVGTVAYMSPEQIQGKPRPASDQYSLGIAVYEWLTGDRPFHGSFTELCTQHMFASPPPLHERLPDIPPFIEQVVTTALAKEPKQRFGSVQAFANALEQASGSQQPTILVPPPPPHISSSLPPTRAARTLPPAPMRPSVTPSLPPTRAANIILPSKQEVRSNDNRPSRVRAATQSSNAKSIIPGSADKSLGYKAGKALGRALSPVPSKEILRIGKRQILAMVVGILVYGCVSYISLAAFHYSLYYYFLPIVTILFFGVGFGPWVGLVTGGMGLIITGSLFFGNYDYLRGDSFNANFGEEVMGFALIGYITGLSLLITKGRRSPTQTFILTSITCIVASLIGLTIASGFFDATYLLVAAFDTLIFLPIALMIYNAITRRGRA